MLFSWHFDIIEVWPSQSAGKMLNRHPYTLKLCEKKLHSRKSGIRNRELKLNVRKSE